MPTERKQPFLLPFETVWIPEDKRIVHVTCVGDGDREDGGVTLLNISHAVRSVEVDAVNDVHQRQRDEVVLNGWVLV